MSRILAAVSSMQAAQRITEPLADLARRLNAEVLVTHISPPASGHMREREQADGEQAIALLRTELEKRHIGVQTLLLFSDDISRALISNAAERQATRSQGGVERRGGDPRGEGHGG